MSNSQQKPNLQERYPISSEKGRRRRDAWAGYLIYIVIFGVVALTAVHAIMLVAHLAGNYQVRVESGLFRMIFTGFRYVSPILMELAGLAATIGLLNAHWRERQKTFAEAIVAIWAVFGLANLITMFTLEAGRPLEGWMNLWAFYGLPISGVVAALLAAAIPMSNPDHLAKQEQREAQEEIQAVRDTTILQVQTSPAMRTVQEHRAWLEAIQRLRDDGYTENEVAYLLSHVPELVPKNRAQLTDNQPQQPALPAGQQDVPVQSPGNGVTRP